MQEVSLYGTPFSSEEACLTWPCGVIQDESGRRKAGVEQPPNRCVRDVHCVAGLDGHEVVVPELALEHRGPADPTPCPLRGSACWRP